MRNLLALLATVVIAFAGIGWYRDWYKVHSAGSDVHITINKEKVTRDVRTGEEKVHQAIEKGLDEREKRAETVQPEPAKVTPE